MPRSYIETASSLDNPWADLYRRHPYELRRRREFEADEFLPTDDEVAARAEDQGDDDVPWWMKILRAPDQIVGGQMLKAALAGDEDWFDKNPVNQIYDWVTGENTTGDYIDFRAVREANGWNWGQADVDSGIVNFAINLVGDILTDPSSFLTPYKAAAKGTKVFAVGRSSARQSARRSTLLREAIDAGGDPALRAAQNAARKGANEAAAFQGADAAAVAGRRQSALPILDDVAEAERRSPQAQFYDAVEEFGADYVNDYWAGAVKRVRKDESVWREAIDLSDQAQKAATRSLLSFGLIGSKRQLVIEGPIFQNLNVGVAKALTKISHAWRGSKAAQAWDKGAYAVDDIRDGADEMILSGSEARDEIGKARDIGEKLQKYLNTTLGTVVSRSINEHGTKFIGNKQAELLAMIFSEIGISDYDKLSDLPRIIVTSMEYGGAQRRLAKLSATDEAFEELRQRALGGDTEALAEFHTKYSDVSLLREGDHQMDFLTKLHEGTEFDPRPGVDYRSTWNRGPGVTLDRTILESASMQPFSVTVSLPGRGIPEQDALRLGAEMDGEGFVRIPIEGLATTLDDGTDVLVTRHAKIIDEDSINSSMIAKTLRGMKSSFYRRAGDEGAEKALERYRAMQEIAKKIDGGNPVSLTELRDMTKGLDLDDGWFENTFIPRLTQSGRRDIDGIIMRPADGSDAGIRWMNKSKLARQVHNSQKLDIDRLEAIHTLPDEWVPGRTGVGSGDAVEQTIKGDGVTEGMRKRAKIEEEAPVTAKLWDAVEEQKRDLLKIFEDAENPEELFESIKKFSIGMTEAMNYMGDKEEALGLIHQMSNFYFPRQLTSEAKEMVNEHIRANIRSIHGNAGVEFAESFMRHREFTDLDTFSINALAYELGIKYTGGTALRSMQKAERAEVVGKVLNSLLGRKMKKKLFPLVKAGDQGAAEMVELINANPFTAWQKRVVQHARVRGRLASIQHIFDEDSPLLYGNMDVMEYAAEKETLDSMGLRGVPINDEMGVPSSIADPAGSMVKMVTEAFNINRHASIEFWREVMSEEIDKVVSAGKKTYIGVAKEMKDAIAGIKASDPTTWTIDSNDFFAVSRLKAMHRTKAELQSALKHATGVDNQELRRRLKTADEQIKAMEGKLSASADELENQARGLKSDTRILSNVANSLKRDMDEIPELKDQIGGVIDDIKLVGDQIRETGEVNYHPTLMQMVDEIRIDVDTVKKQRDILANTDQNSDAYKLALKERDAIYRRIKDKTKSAKDEANALRERAKKLEAEKKDMKRDLRLQKSAIEASTRTTTKEMHDLIAIMREQQKRGAVAYDEYVERFGEERAAKILRDRKGSRIAIMHKDVYSNLFGENGMWQRMHSPATWHIMPNVLDRATRWWKIQTTVGGPFVQSRVRDLASNIFTLAMGGTNPIRLAESGRDANVMTRKFNELLKGKVGNFDQNVRFRRVVNGREEEVGLEEVWQSMSRAGLINSSYVRDELTWAAGDSLAIGEAAAKRKGWEDKIYRTAKGMVPGKDQWAMESPMARFMMGWAETWDSFSKNMGVLAEWKSGRSLDDAAEHVRHWTYGAEDIMSNFESANIRRLIPFYSWTRFALSRTTEKLVTNPGFGGMIEKVSRNSWAAAGGDIEENAQLLPSFLKSNLGIPYMRKENGEISAFMFGGYLPVGDLVRFADAFEEIGRSPKMFNYVMQQSAPHLKVALELGTNRGFWRDAEISQFPGDSMEMFGIEMPTRTGHILKQMRILNEIDRMNLINFNDVDRMLDISDNFMNASNREVPGYQQEGAISRAATGGFGFAPRSYEINLKENAERAIISTRAKAGKTKGMFRKTYEQRDVPSRAADLDGLRESLTDTLARLKRLEEAAGVEKPAPKRQKRNVRRGWPYSR
jgi:hypothetical protein